MADWAKIKFYWKTMLGSPGSLLDASSSFQGTSVANIHNMLETNRWEAAQSLGPHYITFDSGPGKSYGADYLAVSGHNLFTGGSSVVLQYSTDGVSYLDAFNPFTPASDMSFVKEFVSPGAFRFWRLRLQNTAIAPFMFVVLWGEKTELDYASSSFDPHEQEARATVNLSYGGYVTGVHSRYIERSMMLRFDDADAALFEKVREWWDESGMKNFFIAWETSSHPDDVFLMRPEARFSNPFKAGGAARDIVITLTGRKE